MKKLFFACTFMLFFSGITLNAQKLYYEQYDWQSATGPVKDTYIDTSDMAVMLFDKYFEEYYYKDDKLAMVETVHRKVFIRKKESINEFNKVYIPVDTTSDILILKARAISPDGQVVNFNKENLKEIKDEEKQNYKIFAIDGVTEKGTVEFIYTINRKPHLWGSRVFQSEYSRMNVEFRFICPANLELVMKSYNGFPDVTGRLIDDKRYYTVFVDSIPKLKEEEYCNYRCNLMHVEYAIAYNHNKGGSRIYDNNYAARVYWEHFNTFSKDETKAIKTVIKNAGIKSGFSTEQKIRTAEAYVKSHYLIVGSIAGLNSDDLTIFLKVNILDKDAAAKLFIGIFKELGIEYQVVLTDSRFEHRMTEDFESWNFLSDYLLYFPTEKSYMAPGSFISRYNLIPYYLTATNGLFIKEIKYQNLSSGVGSVKYIEAPGFTRSYDSLFVTTTIPDDFGECEFDLCTRMNGYRAYYFLNDYNAAEKNERRSIAVPYMKIISDDSEVEDVKVENADSTRTFFEKPVIISGKAKTSAPIEKAGDKYLFKIGMLIGRQTHLYDVKKRKLDVEMEYNHHYHRTLRVTIPDNYRVTNPEVMKIKAELKKDDKTWASFESNYTINGREINVNITEYYDKILIPLAMYDGFSKVINAAADFNEISLILEKK